VVSGGRAGISLDRGRLARSVPVSTLRSWVVSKALASHGGQRRSLPVIRFPKGQKRFLSFTNLVEVHVLAVIRRKRAHGLDAIRRTLPKKVGQGRARTRNAEIVSAVPRQLNDLGPNGATFAEVLRIQPDTRPASSERSAQ
jgi:hypothetical protein